MNTGLGRLGETLRVTPHSSFPHVDTSRSPQVSPLGGMQPIMRRAGWTVTELPAGHDNAIQWQVARPGREATPPEKVRISRSQRSHADQLDTVDQAPDLPQVYQTDTPSTCPVCDQPSRPSAQGFPTMCRACSLAEAAS